MGSSFFFCFFFTCCFFFFPAALAPFFFTLFFLHCHCFVISFHLFNFAWFKAVGFHCAAELTIKVLKQLFGQINIHFFYLKRKTRVNENGFSARSSLHLNGSMLPS